MPCSMRKHLQAHLCESPDCMVSAAQSPGYKIAHWVANGSEAASTRQVPTEHLRGHDVTSHGVFTVRRRCYKRLHHARGVLSLHRAAARDCRPIMAAQGRVPSMAVPCAAAARPASAVASATAALHCEGCSPVPRGEQVSARKAVYRSCCNTCAWP